TSNEATVGIAGLYQLLITEPISGCSRSATVEVGESNTGFIDLSSMAFPNVISADKDGKNDTWRPFLSNDPNLNLASVFDEYDLMIFDRWGVTVFNSSDGNGRIWSPRESSPGVYYYILYYKLNCGGVQEGRKEGWIQVF
ncbi:MAG: gliding motility-associated C-terminal domain-containing protein, partial [Flavobacteriales bacterium]